MKKIILFSTLIVALMSILIGMGVTLHHEQTTNQELQQEYLLIQSDYDEMYQYYQEEYPNELLDSFEYQFGEIRTKRDDINYFTYTIEIGWDREKIIVHTKQEFDYDVNVILFYNNDKLVLIKEIEGE